MVDEAGLVIFKFHKTNLKDKLESLGCQINNESSPMPE
jgi:hypothetical protein